MKEINNLGECNGKLQYYIELADKREKRIHQLIKKNVDLELEIEDLKWALKGMES